MNRNEISLLKSFEEAVQASVVDSPIPAGSRVSSQKPRSNSSGNSKSSSASSSSKNKKPKDEGVPRKALSAYNIFFQAERVELLKSLPERQSGKPKRSHGKIGFADMARVIGGRWKAICPERKAYFDALAAEDKLRHAREMQEYKQKKQAEQELEESKHKAYFSTNIFNSEASYSMTLPHQFMRHHNELHEHRQLRAFPTAHVSHVQVNDHGPPTDVFEQASYNFEPLSLDDDMDTMQPYRSDSGPSMRGIADLAKRLSRDKINFLVNTFR